MSEINNNSGNKNDSIASAGILPQGDIPDSARLGYLLDFYGQLLSKRQQEVMALYHEENYSLSEIAEEFGISRQAVHDTLKKAEQALAEYEQKLGLVKTLQRSEAVIGRIDEKIDALIAEFAETSSDLTAKLEEIKQIINTLEA